jgi:ABC-2 type transport system ATP-binding protein
MQDVVVSIEHLVKRYGTLEAVRGIDVDVRRGEVLGFLGPNGAGKTTTIRCLLGLLRPTAGRISAFGLDVARSGVEVRRHIAYVPGELRLPDRLSGLQLVKAIATIRGGLDAKRRDELAQRLRVDLGRPLRELSTGNRRKVALLLAFLGDADLLVLDEPTSGLDPLMQHEFLALVREARTAGATVLLSSHVLSEVQRAADRVVVLKAGRVVVSGTVGDLRARARQRVEVWFADDPPLDRLRQVGGLEDLRVDGHRVAAVLGGPIEPLLRLFAEHRVTSLLVEEPDLEEAFLDLYGREAA